MMNPDIKSFVIVVLAVTTLLGSVSVIFYFDAKRRSECVNQLVSTKLTSAEIIQVCK